MGAGIGAVRAGAGAVGGGGCETVAALGRGPDNGAVPAQATSIKLVARSSDLTARMRELWDL